MKKELRNNKVDHKSNNSRQVLGRWGEGLAAEFLVARGLEILSKNFRTPDGEIDLIAKKGDDLVFVEVKTRRNTLYSYPEEAINDEKIEHLESAAGWYLLQHPEYENNWRLDVVTVIGTPDTGEPRVDWFENVTAE